MRRDRDTKGRPAMTSWLIFLLGAVFGAAVAILGLGLCAAARDRR